MPKLGTEDLKERNARNVRDAKAGKGLPTVIDSAWELEWDGPCGDPNCRGDHHYLIATAIIHRGDGEDMPHPILAIGKGTKGLMAPLTKNQVAQLLLDLREVLDELP